MEVWGVLKDRRRVEEGGQDTINKKKKKLSHIALMSSGRKWDTVATHTVTLQLSAPRKRGN